MTQIVDRRSTATVDEYTPAADGERLAKRREVKRKIAESELKLRQARVQTDRVAELNRQADAAVDEHASRCAPIQAELAVLEERIVAATIDRLAVPEDVEARRRELIAALHTENEGLSDAVERCKRLRVEPIREERRLLVEAADGPAMKNKLVGVELGNPQLLLDFHCAKQTCEWAGARLHAAEGHITKNTELAATAERRGDKVQAAYYRARNAKWRAEVAAAREACDEANEISAAAHQRLIDE